MPVRFQGVRAKRFNKPMVRIFVPTVGIDIPTIGKAINLSLLCYSVRSIMAIRSMRNDQEIGDGNPAGHSLNTQDHGYAIYP